MSAVATACETALAGIDAPVSSDIAWFGTRFGHGMGIEFIEPPHIAAYDDTVLEPGMVLAVEPGIATPFGRFHFRQLALVTDEGRELLPAPPMELAFLKSR
jgi:Xaa-Pro aminopeptidase